jgi:hypothetical protein
MADPYTIRIFIPDGDPEGVRIVDRMNWTGVARILNVRVEKAYLLYLIK